MAANTGVGLPGTGTNPGSLTMNLQNGDVPQFRAATTSLEPSGFTINQLTAALQGDANIETTEDLASGVSTIRLAQAHAMTSAAENVTFRNTVTDTVFHPTWQTTEDTGDWASVQRTPVGDLVEDHPFQPDGSQTVTNPNFEFTSLPTNNRLYRVMVEPTATIDNVRVQVQQNNGTEFVDYWRSRPLSFVAGTPIDVAINPFIDLFGNTQYRLIATSVDGDVVVRGNAAGAPRLIIDYRDWVDRDLATQAYVGEYRFDNTVEIAANVTITSANLETYNRKIWLVTGSGTKDVIISDGIDLNFFAFYVVDGGGAIRVANSGGGAAVLIDSESDKRYTGRTSAILFRSAANTYQLLGSVSTGINVRDSGTPEGSAITTLDFSDNLAVSVSGSTATITGSSMGATTFPMLTDTPASLTALDYVRANSAGTALEFINPFVIDGTVDITADVTITSANAATYNRRIWQITGGSFTITIAEGSGLTFFGVYVRRSGDTGTIAVTGADSRINNGTTNIVFEWMQSSTFFAIRANRYNELYNNFRPEGFINLDDTPDSLGTAGQLVAVNGGATALEFINAPTGGTSTFLGLTDTPSSFTAFQAVRANSGGTALEFTPFPAALFTVQDSGTVRSSTISNLNFRNNISVSLGASGSVNIDGAAGGGSTTFLALTDTPAAFTAGQLLRVNAGGTGIEFGGSLGTASTNWDHATLPSGQIPSNSRRWYTYTGSGNVTRALPLESGIVSGWHSFFGNDSTTGTMFLTGDFRGSLGTIALLPQQGCEISYNGSIFLEGPARNLITVSSFPDWSGNPLRPSTSYGGFSTNANGINLNNVGSRTALLNRNVRVVPTGSRDFQFDLEPLDSGNFDDISIGSGFGVINQGVNEVVVRPASNDTLTRGGRTHNFSSGARLSPGASITFVRSGQDTWNTTIQSGTITGGT